MPPINVGIIGLSVKGTAWAKIAHLPYLKASSKYKIVALLNSSKASAEEAIKAFDLGSDTKAYSTPEELAQDTNVHLVVCCVRVDRHYETIKPSLAAGKDVYIEWPIASNTEDSEDIVNLSKGKMVIGLQGHQDPAIRKLKELVESGRIGKVLSSTFTGYGGSASLSTAAESGPVYFYDRVIGGNFISIIYGHALNTVHAVLGNFKTLSSDLRQLQPKIKLTDDDGKVTRTITSDTPDEFTVTGALESGAYLSTYLRRGPGFKGTPGLDWRILGEKGEIRFTSSSLLFVAFEAQSQIEVQSFADNSVEKVEFGTHYDQLAPYSARNVAAVYDASADGDTKGYWSGEDALKLHKELDQVWGEWKA